MLGARLERGGEGAAERGQHFHAAPGQERLIRTRLTGQAAIRSGDPAVTRALLEQAGDLKASLPAADTVDAVATPSVLSEPDA